MVTKVAKDAAFSLSQNYILLSLTTTSMSSEVSKMMQMICEEKGLQYEVVMEAVESALGAAYRKDFGNKQQNIDFKYDPDTGDMQAWDVKEVVADIDEEVLEKAQEEMTARREKAREEDRELTEEEVADLPQFNPKTEMMIKEAVEVKKDAEIGETLRIPLEIPGDFGRMAAQTAKQVVIQKLREAERNVVFEDFKDQEGQIVQGIISRRDRSGNTLVDLGKITGILPPTGQIHRERLRPGIRLPFFVASVEMGQRGPQIMLSRTDKRMVETVFEEEIPEIESGEVVIKGIARDAGNRSKVAVHTDDDSIDPIGSCIGQRGSRITTIIDSLGGEKIDVIQYSEDAVEYISHALSPAKVAAVDLNEETKEATVTVAEDQFSLAIGRGGQNVRLAAELTGWTINVAQEGGVEAVSSDDDEASVQEKLEGDEAEVTVTDASEGETGEDASTEEGESPDEASEESVSEASESTEEKE